MLELFKFRLKAFKKAYIYIGILSIFLYIPTILLSEGSEMFVNFLTGVDGFLTFCIIYTSVVLGLTKFDKRMVELPIKRRTIVNLIFLEMFVAFFLVYGVLKIYNHFNLSNYELTITNHSLRNSVLPMLFIATWKLRRSVWDFIVAAFGPIIFIMNITFLEDYLESININYNNLMYIAGLVITMILYFISIKKFEKLEY